MNFDWNQAKSFLKTAECGSLSTASKALGIAQSTLGRQITALEQQLDIVLFERSPQGLNLTPSGLELLKHVKDMAQAANKISLSAHGQSKSLEGKVCVSAGETISAFFLPRLIKKFKSIEPGIQIEILATGSVSDLSKREADIAIRYFRPTEQELIAKKVSEEVFYPFATKKYIKELGKVKTNHDLKKAQFIGMTNEMDRMLEELKKADIYLSEDNFNTFTETPSVQLELARAGLGICFISDRCAKANLDLHKVIQLKKPLRYDLWLVSHRELKTNLRVRRVFDFLAEAFRD